MQQSSITAWLKKPAAVTKPPPHGPQLPSPTHRPVPPPPAILPAATQTPAQAPAPEQQPPPFTQHQHHHHHHLPLDPRITLTPCTPAHIPALKHLNATLLAVAYPPSFYDEIKHDSATASVTFVALWNDEESSTSSSSSSSSPTPGRVIGAIRCRLPGPQPEYATPHLYISSLGVLAPWRHFGIAGALLSKVMRVAVERYGVRVVRAHVWEASEEAREWYKKRGFGEVGRVEGYYRRLRPGTGVVVQRGIGVGDLLDG